MLNIIGITRFEITHRLDFLINIMKTKAKGEEEGRARTIS